MSSHHVWLLSALLATAGCMPTTSAYLSIPVETDDGQPRSAVEVHVPLQELEQRMPGLDLATLSFYGVGREPIPRRLIDRDGDGTPDAAAVVIAVLADGHTRLVAVCPAPLASSSPPMAAPDPQVRLCFERASTR